MEYVLITPARNEEEFIGKTLRSVVDQTILPKRWVVVSDGSTDRTDEIVREFASSRDWLQLVRLPEQRDRNFAAKVSCFNAGYERVRDLSYDIIGSLDADISFGPDYFDFLLQKFAENPKLGVAGTPFAENGVHYDYRFTNIEHVSGACQLFRRACFEEIGGYVPIKAGGIDWVAVTTARMKGWATRTFPERVCDHHRPMGTGTTSNLRALFKHGQKDYYLGGHPLWQLFRAAYQATRQPLLFGGLLIGAGYLWAALTRRERPITVELVRFNRQEQKARLLRLIRRHGESPGTPQSL